MIAIDLRPCELAHRLVRAQHLRRWGGLLVSISVAFALALSVDWLQRSDLRARAAERQHLESQLNAAREKFKVASGEAEQLSLQIQRADAFRSKRAWSDLLSLVGSCLPEHNWLTLVATEPTQPAPTQIQPAPTQTPVPRPSGGSAVSPPVPKAALTIDAPRELRLAGYAATPADPSGLVTNLKAANVFDRVELIQSRQEPVFDGSYYRFDILCRW